MSRHQEDAADWSGIIEKEVRFEGTLQFSGKVRINGQIKGKIISSHCLVLGEESEVEGEIRGHDILLAGKFNGCIYADGRVEIEAKGVVRGEIHTPCLVINPGALFDGRCEMREAAGQERAITIPIRSGTAG